MHVDCLTYLFAYMYVYIYMYYACVSVHIYIYMCVYIGMYMYLCMCMYVHMYTYNQNTKATLSARLSLAMVLNAGFEKRVVRGCHVLLPTGHAQLPEGKTSGITDAMIRGIHRFMWSVGPLLASLLALS